MKQNSIKMSRNVNYIEDIEGFVDIYLDGQLSRYRINRNGLLIAKYVNGWKVIKPSLKSDGYLSFCLRIEEIKHNRLLHRLLGEYFIDNPHNYPYINHLDGVKLNNNITNLEWCTASMNNLHAHKLKLADVFTRTKGGIPKRVGKYLGDILVKEYKAVAYVKEDGHSRSSVQRSIKNNYCYNGFYWKHI